MTGIEWTDVTWNPVRGCSRVSEGCRNCYAERQAIRLGGPGRPYDGLIRSTDGGPRWTGAARVVDELVEEPLRWRRPRRVFVNSMSDLFHPDVSDDDLLRMFAVMGAARAHTFQVLTKRPRRAREFLGELASSAYFGAVRDLVSRRAVRESDVSLDCSWRIEWPPRNVWLGVSVEDQETADRRIPVLLDTPAALRFVSVEPLLGSVDLRAIPLNGDPLSIVTRDALRSEGISPPEKATKLDWVIVGGESGPRARPCNVAWVRLVVDQCRAAGVPCFVKQLGGHVIQDEREVWLDHGAPECWKPKAGDVIRRRFTHPKAADPAEWPEDLRMRQMPGHELAGAER